MGATNVVPQLRQDLADGPALGHRSHAEHRGRQDDRDHREHGTTTTTSTEAVIVETIDDDEQQQDNAAAPQRPHRLVRARRQVGQPAPMAQQALEAAVRRRRPHQA